MCFCSLFYMCKMFTMIYVLLWEFKRFYEEVMQSQFLWNLPDSHGLRYSFRHPLLHRDDNTKSEKRGTPYPFQNLIRFTTFSHNPENFVLVIYGTKRGNLLQRGALSSLTVFLIDRSPLVHHLLHCIQNLQSVN